MPQAITDAERTRILELQSEGMSRNAICRETGRSAGLVTRVVQAAGRSFERAPEIAAATEAKRVDNASRRADAIAKLYTQSGHLFDRLAADTFTTTGYDRSGNAVTTVLERDATPPADLRHLAATAVNMLQAAARLEDVDKAGAGAAEGRSIVAGLFDALKDAAGQDDG